MSSLQRVCEDHRMVEIVLVHGLRDRREDFSMLVEPLARFGQVSSPDAPGHVGPLDHPFCMIEWLEDVEQHISRTTEPPILFGLSAGGHIAGLRWTRPTADMHVDLGSFVGPFVSCGSHSPR